MNRRSTPLSASATVAGQVLGLLLVLAPAVTSPLPLTGTAGTAVRALAVLAGLAGAAVVFGGLYHRLAPRPPDGVDDASAGKV